MRYTKCADLNDVVFGEIDMNKDKKEKKVTEDKKEPEQGVMYMPIFMCIGLSVGMAIGSAMGNIPVGMCMGIGIGLCFGTALDAANKKKKDEESDNKDNKDDKTE